MFSEVYGARFSLSLSFSLTRFLPIVLYTCRCTRLIPYARGVQVTKEELKDLKVLPSEELKDAVEQYVTKVPRHAVNQDTSTETSRRRTITMPLKTLSTKHSVTPKITYARRAKLCKVVSFLILPLRYYTLLCTGASTEPLYSCSNLTWNYNNLQSLTLILTLIVTFILATINNNLPKPRHHRHAFHTIRPTC